MIYINGIEATEEDIVRLRQDTQAGKVIAYGYISKEGDEDGIPKGSLAIRTEG